MTIKNIEKLSVNGKTVLVRADFNVPLDESGKITDDNRIVQAVGTLQELRKAGAKLVLMSHLGEPEGREAKFSLRPVAAKLSELLKTDVALAPDCVGSEVNQMVKALPNDGVLLLENLRFNPGEKKNDPEFAKALASLADIFVSDAFATAHRKHASMVGVPQLFKEKAAGRLMYKEMDFYAKALETPKRPLCVILGGAKLSTKLNILLNVGPKADSIIIGGAMANTFLAAQGLQMGRSLYEAEFFPKAIELLGTLARKGCKVYLPVDVVVAPTFQASGVSRAVPVQEVPADTMALDIGPATQILYKEAIQSAETIVWNGPMGAFEQEEFSHGTTGMIEALSQAHGTKIVGGGDTDAAIHTMQLEHKFDFISTGGGAFLQLLEGNGLPGFTALES